STGRTRNRRLTDVRIGEDRDAVRAQRAARRQIGFPVEVVQVLAANEDAAPALAAQADVVVTRGGKAANVQRAAEVVLADGLEAAAQIFHDVEDDPRGVIHHAADTGVARRLPAVLHAFKTALQYAADRHARLSERCG